MTKINRKSDSQLLSQIEKACRRGQLYFYDLLHLAMKLESEHIDMQAKQIDNLIKINEKKNQSIPKKNIVYMVPGVKQIKL